MHPLAAVPPDVAGKRQYVGFGLNPNRTAPYGG